MESIAPALVTALNNLGLSNYEARVYAALVLFDNAEAKEIVEFLAISKPSVYEALDRLSERGLAVKRVSKPARYSAVSPEMAVELLMGRHKKAADTAFAALKDLEQKKVRTDREDALWTIYGDETIEYKIRDLFRKATRQISCTIGERYLPIIGKLRIGDIPLRLIVISDEAGLDQKLKSMFPRADADVHVISPDQYFTPPPFAPKEFRELRHLIHAENTLELIVDEEELLMVPPFFSSSVTVLNTRNRGAILQMKVLSGFTWRRLVEGEEFPGFCQPGRNPEPAAGKKDKKSREGTRRD